MIVIIDKVFEKDTDLIDVQSVKTKIAQSIINVQCATSLVQIKNIRKLQGFKNMYRIKIGHYRLGIRIDNDIVKFIRCLHRKDIYRYFPI